MAAIDHQFRLRGLRPGLVAVAPLCAIAAAVLPASAAARSEPGYRISNEWNLSRWAYTYAAAPVRTSPTGRAPVITRLRYATEDGKPEIYLALRWYRDRLDRVWVQIRLPMRPNGRKGWVLRDGLGPLHTVHTQLRLNRSSLRATLYYKSRRVWSAPIGVGKSSTPTPAGHFYVRELLTGYAFGTIYGPVSFGTSAYSVLTEWPGGGVVGLHGTNQPQLVPGRPSHGCIRLKNADILELSRLMPLGTPLLIL